MVMREEDDEKRREKNNDKCDCEGNPQHCVNNIFISPITVPYSVTDGGRCSCAQQEEKQFRRHSPYSSYGEHPLLSAINLVYMFLFIYYVLNVIKSFS